MALGPRLDLRQSQQLVMTPQLQQAIKLLTLTNLELESAVSAEIDSNPLLEAGEHDLIIGPETFDQPASCETGLDEMLGRDSIMASDTPVDVDFGEAVFHHGGAGDEMGPTTNEFQAEQISRDDMGPADNALSMNGSGAGQTGSANNDSQNGDGLSAEALLTADLTLHDHLLTQVGTTFREPEDLMIARHLVDLVDDSGYIALDLIDMAERLGTSIVTIECVLRLMQTFDPVGVCARSLSECLKLQAKDIDRLDPAMEMLLDNLPLLARGDLPALKRLCRVDHEDLADMIREVRGYNPKPGLLYGASRVETVVADVFVRRSAAGSWIVELNTATLPRVLVNQSYHAELLAKALSKSTADVAKQERQFLSECLTSANWLVKALDQRARTILKVASEIVKLQEGFFEDGVRYLKPLTLRTVADAIGMHESTVSRVTTAKYIACSRGLYELKYFFNSSIQSGNGGEAHSAKSVQFRIKELIEAESARNILSDDQIVDILQGEKFDIARRTVAKYREAMNIPSSVQRRRLKAMVAVR